jgi:hypothetical protein
VNIDEIEAVWKAATQGKRIVDCSTVDIPSARETIECSAKADAIAVAAAPAHIAWLVARVRELEEAARDVVNDHRMARGEDDPCGSVEGLADALEARP